jgi:hypothetical protein
MDLRVKMLEKLAGVSFAILRPVEVASGRSEQ